LCWCSGSTHGNWYEYQSIQELKIARPRDFEIDDVVRKALFVFWFKGYESASLTDIEQATGVARMSLYNVFGSKEGLFYAALERYIASTKKLYEKYLVKNDFEGLEQLVDAYVRSEKLGQAAPWGCLMLNTIMANEGVSSQSRKMIEEFRAFAVKRIGSVLREACKRGEIADRSIDCDAWAEFVVVTMWGMKAAIRHSGSMAAAIPVADTLSHIFQRLRSPCVPDQTGEKAPARPKLAKARKRI
jgi:TetR/AcrR family transcriptional repressor of nem operon